MSEEKKERTKTTCFNHPRTLDEVESQFNLEMQSNLLKKLQYLNKVIITSSSRLNHLSDKIEVLEDDYAEEFWTWETLCQEKELVEKTLDAYDHVEYINLGFVKRLSEEKNNEKDDNTPENA